MVGTYRSPCYVARRRAREGNHNRSDQGWVSTASHYVPSHAPRSRMQPLRLPLPRRAPPRQRSRPGWLAGLRAGRCHTREPRHFGCRGRGHTTIPCKRSPTGSPNPLLSRPHEPLGPLSRRRALPSLQPPYAKAPGDPHSHRSRSARRVGAVAGLRERWARGCADRLRWAGAGGAPVFEEGRGGRQGGRKEQGGLW